MVHLFREVSTLVPAGRYQEITTRGTSIKGGQLYIFLKSNFPSKNAIETIIFVFIIINTAEVFKDGQRYYLKQSIGLG